MTDQTKNGPNMELTQDDFGFLMQSPLFDAIPDDARYHLLTVVRPVRLKAGTSFICQGDQGDCFYLIQHGRCMVSVHRGGASQVIGSLGPGDIVGEMAILTGERRNADVVAETDMTLWAISRAAFDEMCEEYPELRQFLTWVVSNRLSTSVMAVDRTVGKYVIEEKIGEGGSSLVYRGRHTGLNMPVAIKMLKHHKAMDPTFFDLFRNEAKTIAQLNHANVVKVYDIDELYRTFFIIMEYVEGQSLVPLLNKSPRPALPKLLDFLIQICSGLMHAHDKGVIHRDVKPGNVLIHGKDQVKLVDFGFACQRGERDEKVKGTVYYMSPEEILGDAMDERADIYSLGIMAYEMFVGRRPTEATLDKEVLAWHLTHEMLDLKSLAPDLPDELARFISDATRQVPAERPRNVRQVMADLAPLAVRLGLKTTRPATEQLNMMGLFLFYRPERQAVMRRLVKEFSKELEKIGARLRGANFEDIDEY